MNLTVLLPLLLLFGSLNAQDLAAVKRIDSIAGLLSQKAATQKHKVVEGTLLLEGNKMSSIRFHLDSHRVEVIVVESSLKDNVTLYYFDDNKLLYSVNFTNGNYNEVESSFYFIGNAAYKKERNGFVKANSDFFFTQVSAYLDLFKEQLKAK
jgi:hypothetical protein